MSTVQTLVDRIFETIRPSEHIEISIGQMQTFINRAAEDARGSGWMIHLEDDESLSFADNTWEYAVPATFAYVHSLRVENDTFDTSTWDEHVPWPFWEIRLNASVPVFYINSLWRIPTSGLAMKVIGQQRPSLYTAITETVDPGMEAFLAQRATAYALFYMSAGNPTLDIDRSRLELARTSLALSERLLSNHPQEFRQKPNAKLVPGR